MKILRRDRSGDLKGPNSPYKTERIVYWTWFFLRHPISAAFDRIVEVHLTDDTFTGVLHVYGNFDLVANSGIQFRGVWIAGDAAALRRLASLLVDRAERVEAVQELLDAGTWPSDEDRTGIPAGFGPDDNWRLGNAPLAGREAGA